MKNMKVYGFIMAVLLGAAVFAALSQFGEKSPIIVSGRLVLPEELTNSAMGVRTVFITVFDADSSMPMPLGAMRESIATDASGKFMDFMITPERIQMMNPEAPMPKSLRVKARLDLDGMGGADQPGDITGQAVPVSFGSENVEIILNNLVSQ